MKSRRILLAAALVTAPSLCAGVPAFASGPPAPDQPVELPRSVTYAGTLWTIESAGFEPGTADEASTVHLGFTAVNQLDTYSVSVPVELLAVELPDGSLARGTTLDDLSSEYYVELEPGATTAGTAVFELDSDDDVDLSQISFVIDEPGRVRATLPLGGPEQPQPYPMTALASGTTGPIAGTCSDDARVELTVNGAIETLELGPQRAEDDTVFLTVNLRIAAISGSLGFACIDGPFLRLAAGTAVLEPTGGTDVSESLDVGTTIDTAVSFAVPLDVTTFELRIGADGATTATVAISLPDESIDAETTAPHGKET